MYTLHTHSPHPHHIPHCPSPSPSPGTVPVGRGEPHRDPGKGWAIHHPNETPEGHTAAHSNRVPAQIKLTRLHALRADRQRLPEPETRCPKQAQRRPEGEAHSLPRHSQILHHLRSVNREQPREDAGHGERRDLGAELHRPRR